jgi:hypothetical protein
MLEGFMDNIGAISVQLPGWRNLYNAARGNLEWIAAIVAVVEVLLWRDWITASFRSEAWDLGALYAAIFDWSSIQAAFLFGIYAFFLSRTEAFLKAVTSSPFFPSLRRYVVRTLYLSMLLTVLSLPMLVAPLDIETQAGYIVLAALCGLTVFTFFCFLRVIRVFGKIERKG